jgi:hypothetical protein
MRVFRSERSDSEEEVGLDELWTTLCTKNTKFPAKYKVYSFFRDQRYLLLYG